MKKLEIIWNFIGELEQDEDKQTIERQKKSRSYPYIQYGIKLTAGNVVYSDNILTFPYFCSFLLKSYLKRGELHLPQQEYTDDTLDTPN